MQASHWRAIAAAMLATLATACSHGEGEGRVDQTRREMTSAAAAPLRDVGLIRPDVPDVIEALRYPYSTATLSSGCPAVQYEIGQLDAVLGPESYQPGQENTWSDESMDVVQDAAVDAVRDVTNVIPFRSWVRRASGAARAARQAERAIELGQTRRAFLRGYGSALGCVGIVPAPPPAAHSARRANETPVPQN